MFGCFQRFFYFFSNCFIFSLVVALCVTRCNGAAFLIVDQEGFITSNDGINWFRGAKINGVGASVHPTCVIGVIGRPGWMLGGYSIDPSDETRQKHHLAYCADERASVFTPVGEMPATTTTSVSGAASPITSIAYNPDLHRYVAIGRTSGFFSDDDGRSFRTLPVGRENFPLFEDDLSPPIEFDTFSRHFIIIGSYRFALSKGAAHWSQRMYDRPERQPEDRVVLATGNSLVLRIERGDGIKVFSGVNVARGPNVTQPVLPVGFDPVSACYLESAERWLAVGTSSYAGQPVLAVADDSHAALWQSVATPEFLAPRSSFFDCKASASLGMFVATTKANQEHPVVVSSDGLNWAPVPGGLVRGQPKILAVKD